MKSYSAVIICAFLFTNNTFSQTDTALKYAETITQSGLKRQLTIIASAEMEGRETGTEGQRKAAARRSSRKFDFHSVLSDRSRKSFFWKWVH